MITDAINAPDTAGTEMVRRIPNSGLGSGEFELGAHVILRESRTPIFSCEGSLKMFESGCHTLSTLNLPILGSRMSGRGFGQLLLNSDITDDQAIRDVSDELCHNGNAGTIADLGPLTAFKMLQGSLDRRWASS